MSPTFPCIPEAYLIQDNTLYRIDLPTGRRTVLSASIKGNVQALVYNPTDQNLYGVDFNRVVRILPSGEIQPIAELRTLKGKDFVPNMGAIDSRGQYWLSIYGREYITIDLNPGSLFPGAILNRGVSTFPSQLARWSFPTGWAWSPWDMQAVYGMGYDYQSRRTVLFRWQSRTGRWEVFSEADTGIHGDLFGAVVATRDGIIYGMDDNTGDIVRFNISDPHRAVVNRRAGPVSRRVPKVSTAARCPMVEDR
ncbi:hypothetical protein CDD80_4114 [Ophiocordyceps camponoti-rufipedis]|uniref:DUF6923 domain-containing protein n=1 Tax=Ophiocordyceps camponoti-rufipedis TaxID=2004952 RepID=A0A2C5YZG0_9HYPO|nr:hypothetical protein CDD80_4114 [Ophiocordyceps camponoti-rufipedis]